MKRHENCVAQQSFIVMCHILKKQEGIYYREIAGDMEVDPALFCRWLNETVKMSRHYNEKVEKYFLQPQFAKYRERLIRDVSANLNVHESGAVSCLMKHMKYGDLVHYLFDELGIEEIEKENHLNGIFPDIVREAMERKAQVRVSRYVTYDILDNIFDFCPEEVCRQLEKRKIIPDNTIVMDIDDQNNVMQRVVVHFNDKETREEIPEYEKKCRLMTAMNPFGHVDHIVFLKMPEDAEGMGDVPGFERMSDIAARKLLKIIKKMSQN